MATQLVIGVEDKCSIATFVACGQRLAVTIGEHAPAPSCEAEDVRAKF